MGSLTYLLHLYLSDNQLTGGIPAGLGSLTSLTELYLHNNQLTGGIPAELGNLTNLTRLGLSLNQLTGEIPARTSWTFSSLLQRRNRLSRSDGVHAYGHGRAKAIKERAEILW